MKPKHQRLLFVSFSVACAVAASLLILSAFRDNIVFFFTPSELMAHHVREDQVVRLGGLVEQGSVEKEGTVTRFRVTDGAATLPVRYAGALPSLFREGQGVVAEGVFARGVFQARLVLAKHDETYIPRDVVEKLKQTGHWHGAP